MIRLIGIDVDGTLVGSSGKVSAAIWQAAARARDAGIRIALCSGRPAFGLALEYARQLDAQGWHIFQNGASVVDLATHQSRSTPLPQEIVASLVGHARRTGSLLELYSDDEYVCESDSEWAFAHAELLGVPFEPRSFDSLSGAAVRAQWLLTAEQAAVVASQPHEGLEVAQSSSPLMPGVRFVGMTREGVSKGTAIRTVAGAYDVALEHVMYVGDSGNDLPALSVVGYPVAMGNSEAAVVDCAVRTVGHVEEAGLAEAIDWAVSLAQGPQLAT